jgi:hypothetical protein
VKLVSINCEASNEVIIENVRSNFAPKIVLVNHEHQLPVDNVLSNLAIKYNMLYLCVYELIYKNIEKQTEIGKALEKSYHGVELDNADCDFEHPEFMYSAVHYDSDLVIKMICQTIAEKKTSQ